VSSRRVAAIDCGTNSIRLLVADHDPAADSLTDVHREMRIVRLGEGVDRTGTLSAQALSRTFAAIDEYRQIIETAQAGAVRFVATSATRDAMNRDDFVWGVRERLGVEPEVIDGHDEATFSFDGATRGLGAVRPLPPDPYLVVDIGGGSTEFVLGTTKPLAARSVDVGCVRLTERHFRHDPPLPAEVAAARDDVDAAIAEVVATVPLRSAGTLIGLAGTVTTVAGIALSHEVYDPERLHHAVITAADVHRTTEMLLYTERDRRAVIPVMHPGRVDVIMAGALILSTIVAYAGVADVLVSEHDILDGIAWSIVAPPASAPPSAAS
jgi:exopolyphosphatase/guanosine-5'-triphosphate,3'-diphosphate pyrophosphatase